MTELENYVECDKKMKHIYQPNLTYRSKTYYVCQLKFNSSFPIHRDFILFSYTMLNILELEIIHLLWQCS